MMKLGKARTLAKLLILSKPKLMVELGEIARRIRSRRVARGHAGMCYAPYISDASEAPLERHI